MKKRSFKKLIMAAATLAMLLGVSVTTSAYSKEAGVASATDSQGNSVEAAFTLDNSLDSNLTDKFWELGKDAQQDIMSYYGTEYITTDCFATGTLDLSKTNASEGNPVTVTFSMKEDMTGYGYPEKGERWIYAVQQTGDGSYKIIPAQSDADRTITAKFTDAGTSKILLLSLDLARESFDTASFMDQVADVTGIQSAVDAAGNPVNVTAAPLDWDRKMVAIDVSFSKFQTAPVAAVDVNLEGSGVSESNPVTVTFQVPGVNANDAITLVHKKADGTWETIVGTAGNGTVTATFTSFSPVAFVRTGVAPAQTTETTQTTNVTQTSAATPAVNNTNARVNPKTGDESAWLVMLFGMLCVASAGTFVYVSKKRTVKE